MINELEIFAGSWTLFIVVERANKFHYAKLSDALTPRRYGVVAALGILKRYSHNPGSNPGSAFIFTREEWTTRVISNASQVGRTRADILTL